MKIALVSLKGGVGKTTSAVHLATYLQEKNPTLLVDADRNRSALVWARDEKVSFQVATEAGSTILASKFTHIVTDMKARPDIDDLKKLVQDQDLIILPTTPNHLDLDATLKAVEIIQELKAPFKILLTKVDSRTINGRKARKTLQDHELPIFKTEIPLLIAFEKASENGLTVKDYNDYRSRQAWRKYEAVGKEILA